MVFQEPLTALNPVLTIGRQLTETILRHESVSQAQAQHKAIQQLERVRIPQAAARLAQYPHELSGGQRQRLCIARALSVQPKLIIADEPVAALDVSIARQITDLMQELQQRLGVSFLFISHDLAVVERLCHRIAVMRAGRIVETGPTDAIIGNPREDYSKGRIAAVPGRIAPAVGAMPERQSLAG